MSNYGEVIFTDMQMDEPRYLCLRENGELYICTVVKDKDKFFESNVCDITEQEAMIFVAAATRKAMGAIKTKEIQR